MDIQLIGLQVAIPLFVVSIVFAVFGKNLAWLFFVLSVLAWVVDTEVKVSIDRDKVNISIHAGSKKGGV